MALLEGMYWIRALIMADKADKFGPVAGSATSKVQLSVVMVILAV
ncbi:hypothetical protein [Streptosporangium sp. CA-115845]